MQEHDIARLLQHGHHDFFVGDFLPEMLVNILYPKAFFGNEEDFFGTPAQMYSHYNPGAAVWAVVLYLIVVHGGTHYMKAKQAINCDNTMKVTL